MADFRFSVAPAPPNFRETVALGWAQITGTHLSRLYDDLLEDDFWIQQPNSQPARASLRDFVGGFQAHDRVNQTREMSRFVGGYGQHLRFGVVECDGVSQFLPAHGEAGRNFQIHG